jgi:hypothetical protein
MEKPPNFALLIFGPGSKKGWEPGRGSRKRMIKPGRYSSGQRGQTVNLLTYVFTGSNPVLPTASAGASAKVDLL